MTNSFIWQDTVALTKGRNNMRFGVEFKRHEVDVDSPVETDGLLQIATFGDFLLGQSAAQNGSPHGLSNVTTSQAGGGIFRRNERYTDFAVFAQDDIKLDAAADCECGSCDTRFLARRRRLADGWRTSTQILPQGQVPATGTFSGFTVPSNFQGIIPAGVVQTSYAGLWKTPYGDVAPRLGFVWQMTEKPVLVLRGGFGMYFDQHSGNLAEVGISQPPYSTLQIVAGGSQRAGDLAESVRSSVAAHFKLPDLHAAHAYLDAHLSREPTRTSWTARRRSTT